MEQKINARLVIEAQGKPAEYVKERLETHVAKIKEVPGAEVYEAKFDEASEVQEGLFSSLVDVGVKADNFETLAALVIGFGPSAIVIMEPDRIEITARELQNSLNDVAALLHNLAQSNLDLRVDSFITKARAAQERKE